MTIKLNVPFYKQTTELNCGPVALKMALEFLGESYNIEELEKLTEIKQGKAVSTSNLALTAAKLGFKIKFFSKILNFNPGNLKLDFYKEYIDFSKTESEQTFTELKKLNADMQEKTLTLEEIQNNIKEDRIIIILLDWNIIKNQNNKNIEKKGYQGHFVPIVGYDKENIYVHNHGFLNPAPFLAIEKDIFEKARKSPGTDEDVLIILRKE